MNGTRIFYGSPYILTLPYTPNMTNEMRIEIFVKVQPYNKSISAKFNNP